MFLIIGETAQNVPQDKYERKEMKKNVSWWSFIRFQSTLGSYGNNSMLNSDDWTNSANAEAEKLKENLGISDTTSTNKTGSTNKTSSTGTTGTTKTYASASSVSGFLMGYQNVLKELETSSAKLTGSKANNVFQSYDAALKK